MDASQINSTLYALHDEVFQKIYNPAKDNFDIEVKLPEYSKEKIELKKEYLHKDDSLQKQRRRAKRPGKLEEAITQGHTNQATALIREQYFTSITAVTEQCDEQFCNAKTARKILKCALDMVAYGNVDKIPKSMVSDSLSIVSKWLPHSKILYKCSKTPEMALNYMGMDEIRIAYETYLFAKKLVLVNCDKEEDYREKISSMHNNKIMNAVYAAARALM